MIKLLPNIASFYSLVQSLQVRHFDLHLHLSPSDMAQPIILHTFHAPTRNPQLYMPLLDPYIHCFRHPFQISKKNNPSFGINPSMTISEIFSYEMLYDYPPTYLNLKVFGSLCFASTLENHITKLDSHTKTCIFLGYKMGLKVMIFHIFKIQKNS